MITTTELPPGRYIVDTEHSHIGFVAKLGLGLKAKGRFERFESVIDIGTSPAESSMTLTVRTESVRTGIAKRDEHLRADNVLAVGEFPTMEFAAPPSWKLTPAMTSRASCGCATPAGPSPSTPPPSSSPAPLGTPPGCS